MPDAARPDLTAVTDYDAATDANNEDLAEYHKRRAKMAYERAVFYKLKLINPLKYPSTCH